MAFALLLAVLLVVPGCGGGGSAGPAAGTSLPSAVGGGVAFDPLSPAAVPQAPALAPVPVGPQARVEEVQAAGPTTTLTYEFPAGWSLVSFPLASVTSTSGFQYQMYGFGSTSYTLVDPASNPGAIDTSKGYWAYFASAASVTVTGPANTDGTVTSISLQPGWNLVGCPSTTALPTSRMTLTRQGGTTQVLEEVSSDGVVAGSQALYSYLFAMQPGGLYDVSLLTNSNVSLTPRAGHWIFSWTAAELNLHVVPPSPAPSVSGLSASTVAVGDTLTISGSGFGQLGTGVVSVKGVAIQAADVVSWTDNSIQIRVPDGLPSGNLVVLVNRYPSNRIGLQVSTGGGGGGTTGSLSGRVQSTTGTVLAGAQVLLDSGHSATSDASGNFLIDGIPAGDHLVYVTLLGYQTAVGQVTITAGATRSVLIELSSSSGGGGGGGGGEQTGNLAVRGYPWYSGGERYWAYRIEIQEYGNYAERWSNTFYTDLGDTYNQVTANGAIVGRTYVVKITWRNASGQEYSNTWWRKLDSTSQTESFYNP